MWPVRPCVRGSTVTLVLTLAALGVGPGCAKKLASAPWPSLTGCGGLFTPVPLPPVTSNDQRALEESVPRLTASELNLRLRGNYYRILYDDGGVTGESRDAFVTRMLSEEHAPPGLLAGVVLKSVTFAPTSTPAQQQALRQAVGDARKPLEQRLERVAARIAAAATRPDVSGPASRSTPTGSAWSRPANSTTASEVSWALDLAETAKVSRCSES